jgi:hypothetical protein
LSNPSFVIKVAGGWIPWQEGAEFDKHVHNYLRAVCSSSFKIPLSDDICFVVDIVKYFYLLFGERGKANYFFNTSEISTSRFLNQCQQRRPRCLFAITDTCLASANQVSRTTDVSRGFDFLSPPPFEPTCDKSEQTLSVGGERSSPTLVAAGQRASVPLVWSRLLAPMFQTTQPAQVPHITRP